MISSALNKQILHIKRNVLPLLRIGEEKKKTGSCNTVVEFERVENSWLISEAAGCKFPGLFEFVSFLISVLDFFDAS